LNGRSTRVELTIIRPSIDPPRGAMAAPTEPSGARRAIARDPRRPTHLLRWTDDGLHADTPPSTEEFAASLGGAGFDLGTWLASVRHDDARGVAAAVYPNHVDDTLAQLDVVELTLAAAGLDEDSDGHDHRVFTGDTMPTSLRALRTWAVEQLDGRDCSIDEVVLVLSELSTNVERHAHGWLTVDLIDTQDVLIVAVTDPSVDRLPVLRDVGPDELTGRGLLVVASLALVWGVVVRESSKTVWAALPCAPAG
jgi:anti-sigma regulatory factor (Ser/Thr protein kinase)